MSRGDRPVSAVKLFEEASCKLLAGNTSNTEESTLCHDCMLSPLNPLFPVILHVTPLHSGHTESQLFLKHDGDS